MNRNLIRLMHVCALVSTGIVLLFLASTLIHIDSFEAAVILIVVLFLLALPLGFIGWVLAITLLISERHNRTKHSVYAAVYVLFLTVCFSWLYLLVRL